LLLAAECWTTDSGCELGVNLLHLILHFVLFASMNCLHNLNGILLIADVDLPSKSDLLFALPHLFVDPVRLHFLPLFLIFISINDNLIVVSDLRLEVYLADILVEIP